MSKGLDFDQLYPGRFLKAGEFQGRDVTLKIASVKVENLEGDDKKKKPKAILSFEATAKGTTPKDLVLCKTNGLCLRAMFGRDSGAWVGQRVTFCPELVDAFGAKELAIRVRGSPDLSADVTFELKLHQKKPRTLTMKKTANGRSNAAAQAPAASSPPAPGSDYVPPEPPPDVVLPGQAGSGSAEKPSPLSDADAPGGAA